MRPLVLLLLLGGCAASRPDIVTYDASTGRTAFVSPKVLVGNIHMGGGLASGHRVMMQAFASCSGENCAPDEVEVAFLNDSSADLNLDYRRVEIIFNGNSLDWEDSSRLHEPAHYLVPRGEFLRVPLSRGDFAAMASAADVEIYFGLTGSTQMRMPTNRRAPLLDLVAAMPAR